MTSSIRRRRCVIRKPMVFASGFTKPYCRSFTRSHSDEKFIVRSKNYNTIWMTGYTTTTMSVHIKAKCAVGALRCKHLLQERRRGTIKSPYGITEFDLTAVSIKSGNCQTKSRLLQIIASFTKPFEEKFTIKIPIKIKCSKPYYSFLAFRV